MQYSELHLYEGAYCDVWLAAARQAQHGPPSNHIIHPRHTPEISLSLSLQMRVW